MLPCYLTSPGDHPALNHHSYLCPRATWNETVHEIIVGNFNSLSLICVKQSGIEAQGKSKKVINWVRLAIA
jgi:hypothetical protein